MYVNTHSYYSLRYGTFSPATLLQLAQENNCNSIALTDINTTSACLEFIRDAPKFNVRPVIGVDFRNGVQQQFILLAKNNKGFEHINKYLTSILHNKEKIPDHAPELEHTFVIYPFRKEKKRQLKKANT